MTPKEEARRIGLSDHLWMVAIAMKEVRDGIGSSHHGPVIRIEPAYWRRYAPEAYKHMRIKQPPDQDGRYRILKKLRAIDDTAALMSVSMGCGQVMGANFGMLGYQSVQDMWEEAQTGPGQWRQMAQYLLKAGIVPYLNAGHVDAVAARYNGPAYRKNRWAIDVLRHYERLSGKTVRRQRRSMQLGASGQMVSRLQRALVKLGYRITVDGEYGRHTEDAVRSFQSGYGIVSDGIAGKETMRALSDALDTLGEPPVTARETATVADVKMVSRTARAAGVSSTITGSLAAGTAVLTAATEMRDQVAELAPSVSGAIPWIAANWQGVALVGLCIAWYMSRKALMYRVDDHRSGDSL